MCGGGSGARAALGEGEREGLYVLLLRKVKGKCFYYLAMRQSKCNIRKEEKSSKMIARTHTASQARGAGQEGRKE